MDSRNSAIDFFKFISAIFVIGIHTRPLAGLSVFADFVSCDIIFRIAVPFFVVCTGFYLSIKISSASSWTPVKSMVIKLLKLYVCYSLLYFIILVLLWNKEGIFDVGLIIGWIKSFCIGESYYHMWYLSAMVVALLLFYPIVRYVPLSWRIVVILLLWLIGVFNYIYSDVLSLLKPLVIAYNKCGAFTIALFRVLPLLLLGDQVACRKISSKVVIMVGLLFSAAGLVIEALCLKNNGAERVSYILFTLPVAFFFFSYVEQLSINSVRGTMLISRISSMIYLIHPAIIVLINSVFDLSSHQFMLFVFTTILSIIVSCCFVYLHSLPKKVEC